MAFKRIVILDGYNDEPAGLGVPPYIDVYSRLIAGAIWLADKSIEIIYWTIDEVRNKIDEFIKQSRSSDLVVFIAGPEVPGKYIGGKPLTFSEAERLTFLLRDTYKVLAGPAARYGFGGGGGSYAVERKVLYRMFDDLVHGDPEIYFYNLVRYGPEKAEPWKIRENYKLANKAFIRGAKIITQHPNYGWNLIVEIETFRGCPRWINGGCSFCIEPRYGKPLMREPESIVKEVEHLYRYGARHFRIGRQSDILAYMARDVGEKEYPEPNLEALEKLFYGIRNAAPGLRVLHIDNVNPGTIIHNREKSIKALKIIIKYHTPGDVAALGIESFDERVVRQNNLKVYPDEALEVIRIINMVGSHRGWNGLPHLLPGINLVYGLLGESKNTYRINYEYLKKIAEQGLLVRRINIRKVAVLENTPLWMYRKTVEHILSRHNKLYSIYRTKIMNEIDRIMLSRIVPIGSIMRYLYTEKHIGEFTIARQPASYPITVKIPGKLSLRRIVDVRVKRAASKSVVGVIS